MITLELIQNVLFPGDEEQVEFIVRADEYGIPGDNFSEKLHHVFYTSDEKTAQLVLGPLLRKKVFTVLERCDTEHAKEIKNTFIKIAGENEFDRCLNEFTSPSNDSRAHITADFFALYQTFVTQWGMTAWGQCIHATETTNTPDSLLFSELKTQFIAQYSETLWHRVFDEKTIEFDTIRNTYITTWGEAAWVQAIALSPDQCVNNAPSVHAFIVQKNAFIEKWGAHSWEQVCNDTQLAQARNSANVLYWYFVEQIGLQMWNRIYHAEPIVQYFDTLKQAFIATWGLETWHDCFSESDHTLLSTLTPSAKQDFAERKHDFIDKWGFDRNRNISELFVQDFDETQRMFVEQWGAETWEACVATPNNTRDFLALQQQEAAKQQFRECRENFLIKWGDQIWNQTQFFSIISPEATQLIADFKAIFTERWGTPLWQEYITRHSQNPCFAENSQLEILAELFNLRLEVTPITRGIQDTTACLHEGGDSTIHVYCRDNMHWHIDEIEADRGAVLSDNRCGYTIPNGDCGYHVYVQFLWLSLRGLSPRKIIVSYDADSLIVGQRALLAAKSSSPIQDTVLHSADESAILPPWDIAVAEGANIRSIRKELALPMENLSLPDLGQFIQTRANLLIRLIQEKKLPFYNRLPLLRKIAALAQLSDHTEQQVNLDDLKTILLRITNTLYIPNTQDVETSWTHTQYQTNIEQLKQSALDIPDAGIMHELYATIRTTNFAERSMSEYAVSNDALPFYAQNFEPGQDDLFSATLSVAGVLMLVTGITCLASMVLLILISGITPLGLTLMAVGLKSIATAISGVIGLTAPQTAVTVSVVASSMLVGCGLTLFGEFPLPPLEELSPVPSLLVAAGF